MGITKGTTNRNRPRKRGKHSAGQRKRRRRERKEAESVREGLIPAPAKKPRNEGDASTSNDVTIKVEPTVNDEEATVDLEQPAAVSFEQPAAVSLEQPAAINCRQAAVNKKSSKFRPGPYRIQGRRIVDASYFITELLNLSVHNESGNCSLADMSTTMECTKGIVSGFVFRCRVCKFRKVVWTEDPEDDTDDMNADAILATMGLANDLQSMNRYFAKMKLPRFNQHFFKWKYKRLNKVTVVGGGDIGDGEEWCGGEEEDRPSEGEKAEVLIHDSIVIKHEPEEIFSDTECEELIGTTHLSEIPSSGIAAAVEMDKNIAAGSGSSSATAERDKKAIETFTLNPGSDRAYRETSQQMKMPGNSETGVHGKKAIETFTLDAGLDRAYSKTNEQRKVSGNSETGVHGQDKLTVSVIDNNLHTPKVDSTFGSFKKAAAKRPYVAECVTSPESNLSKRVYAYPVEFLVSLSKFVWSSLFICVDCLEDFPTHELIKAHCCKTYSKCILGVPPVTNFQKMLPSEKTRCCFETLKSSMAEKKSVLDLAVSASKEVQRMMNLHAQSKTNTEQKIKTYELAVAKEKSSAKGSKDSEVSLAVTSAFSEIKTSLVSEKKAEKLLEGAKRNQINILEAAAEATERECFALVEFVKSLREDKVASPQKTLENRQEDSSKCQEISRTSSSPIKNLP